MEISSLAPRVRRLLTRILPDPSDSALLRAALLSGNAARDGWETWRGTIDDPVRTLGTDPRYLKILVPILGRNLAANDIDPGRAFTTYARAAHVTETLRIAAFRRECRQAIGALNAASIRHVVLKGAALGETVYPDPALRHAHDLDLLLDPADLPAATAALSGRGFRPGANREVRRHHLPPLVSPSGLPVELHQELSYVYDGLDMRRLGAGAVSAIVAGEPTLVLSRAHAFVHTCIHAASCPSATNLRWVCDGWWLARSLTRDDWTEVASLTREVRAAIPVALTAGYLALELGVVIPEDANSAITRAAAAADALDVSAASLGARETLPHDLGGILRMSGPWRDRFDHALWRLAPPPRHVRLIYDIERGWRVPWRYVRRLGRGPANLTLKNGAPAP